MPVTRVGNELNEAQFGEIIRSIAQGIADGQRALDLGSIQTMAALSNTMVELIPEVTEVITPQTIPVQIPGQPSVQVTGARVTATASDPVAMSALQAGITPTFYQFTEAVIALKLSVQLRETDETDSTGTISTRLQAFGSHVNFRTQSTYSYGADASSSVSVTMRPTPPPQRLFPATVTVNALGPKPVVNVGP
jgi:hypothetical protein